MNACRSVLRYLLALLCANLGSLGVAQDEIFERPIYYGTKPSRDAVAILAQQLEAGTTKLEWQEGQGWLPSLLKQLDVAPASQVMVFSKTSLQIKHISPENPRAIFFNDDVYIGFVPGGGLIELSAVDPEQGALFYSIQQSSLSPKIERDQTQCLSCHANAKTKNVPGYLVRSVFTGRDGQPIYSLGTTTTDHTTPFVERFGGWYVTGQHGSIRHRGNALASLEKEPPLDIDEGANLQELPQRFSTIHYPASTSDIVSLLVLEHQTQGHNFITAANYETRRAEDYQQLMNEALGRKSNFVSDSTVRRIDKVAMQLAEYFLFKGEASFASPISGDQGFQTAFAGEGILNSHDRSLRQFDLQSRLFKYPCSYLIESEAFAALPNNVRLLTLQKIAEVLANAQRKSLDTAQRLVAADYPHLTADVAAKTEQLLCELNAEFRDIVNAASKSNN